MKLKEIRQKKGLTQQELSVQSGINLSTIQKLERGENNLSGAKFSTVLALYRALGSDVFIAAGMAEEGINNENIIDHKFDHKLTTYNRTQIVKRNKT